MAFVDSKVVDGTRAAEDALSVKIVVAGGFGVGKTTLVGAVGAIGAVVLVDSRRLADCFGAVDYVEQRDIPFIVALNAFDGVQQHEVDEVRDALQLGPEVPFVVTDARERESVKNVLVTLVEHAMAIV